MITVTPKSDHSEALKQFSIPDAAIAQMRDEFMPLKIIDINDTKGFKMVRAARITVKKHRIQVEKVRKELKADALAYGRKVDGEAKRITALLAPIESYLQDEESRIEDIKERIRNELMLRAEAEEQAKFEAETARLQAIADIEAARLKAIQDAEDARLKAEAAKLAEVRRVLDRERKEINAERKRLERIEREEAEKARLEALRPDCEKILAFAETVRTLEVPELSEAGDDVMDEIGTLLESAAVTIEDIAESL